MQSIDSPRLFCFQNQTGMPNKGGVSNNPTKPIVIVNRVNSSGGTSLAKFQGKTDNKRSKSKPSSKSDGKSKPRIEFPPAVHASHEPIHTVHNNDHDSN